MSKAIEKILPPPSLFPSLLSDLRLMVIVLE
jgi:hypothetical protein